MKNRSDDFDAEWYVLAYPDVNGSGLSPLEHYETIGRLLGRPGVNLARPPIVNAAATEVLVSIICVTFNHERFISECLSSILSQDTDFGFEVIVADDCSSDGTAEVVRQFAETDSRIKFIHRDENLGPGKNFTDAAKLARGQFLAICEGDDYWIDNSKLQRQAELLLDNPKMTLCFHPVEVIYDDLDLESVVFPNRKEGFELRDLIRENFIQTNTVLYRWRFSGGFPSNYNPDVVPQDWHLHLLHAELGEIGFIDRVMAVYRRHPGGMWSTSDSGFDHRRRYIRGELSFFSDLATRFGGFYANDYLRRATAVFWAYAEKMLERRLYEELAAVARDFPDLADRALSDLNSNGPLDYASGERLRDTIFSGCSVDVVVLTFNHSDTIGQCLRSILRQKCDFPVNIIVGDDCSQDGTEAVVRGFVGCDAVHLQYRRSPNNVGMLRNLQSSLEASAGPFVAFCEGDDYWISDRKLHRQVLQMLRRPDAGMTFNRSLLEIVESGDFEPHGKQSEISGSTVSFVDIYRDFLTANFSSCLYRRAAIDAVPEAYFDTVGAADWLFNLFVADKFEVCFDRNLMSVYRIHELGLWSGLGMQEQLRRVRQAQIAMRDMFGPARGVDQTRVHFSVTDIAEPGQLASVAAILDLPSIDKTQLIELGSIKVEGWCVHRLGKHVEGYLRLGDDEVRTFPLDFRRPDVTLAFEKEGERAYRDERCGFDFRLPVSENTSTFDLGLSFGKEIVWWKRIVTTIDDRDEKRNASHG